MRFSGCGFLLAASSLLQAQPWDIARQPAWMESLLKVWEVERNEGIAAADALVDQAWKAAVAAGPRDPHFLPAANTSVDYYTRQGRDLKAEALLQQAIALSEPIDRRASWHLTEKLAWHYRNAQMWRKAMAVYSKLRDLARNPPQSTEFRAHALHLMASLKEEMGELEEAEALFKETGDAPSEPVTPWMMGLVPGPRVPLWGSGLPAFYARLGRTEEADQLYRQRIAAAEGAGSPEDLDAAMQEYVSFLRSESRLDDAIEITRRRIASRPQYTDGDRLPVLLYDSNDLAYLLNEAGRKQEALDFRRQTLDQIERAAGQNSQVYREGIGTHIVALVEAGRLEVAEEKTNTLLQAESDQQEVAEALHLLARIRQEQKRDEEAEQLRRKIQAIGRELHQDQPKVEHSHIQAHVKKALGELERGDIDTALRTIEGAFLIAAASPRLLPEDARELSYVFSALLDKERPADAARVMRETVTMLVRAWPADHPHLAAALEPIVDGFNRLGLHSESEPLIRRIEEILVAASGADSPTMNRVSEIRAQLHRMSGNCSASLEERQRMLQRIEAAQGSASQPAIDALTEIARLLEEEGDWRRAEPLWLESVRRSERGRGPRSDLHAALLNEVAKGCERQGLTERALDYNARAVAILRRTHPYRPIPDEMRLPPIATTSTALPSL